MTMKLYSWDLSPYSARVRMQVYAKGLTDIAIEQPSTYGTVKFYQDHPIGRIPLLEIDGEAIPESAVIAEYLEEIYPDQEIASRGTANPVPFHLVDDRSAGLLLRDDGSLADVAPTVLGILGIAKPDEMTGSDLRVL